MTFNRNLGLSIYHISYMQKGEYDLLLFLSLITKLGKVLVTMLPKLVKGK